MTLRLAAYELLTQGIVALGWARARLSPQHTHVRAPGRVFDHYGAEWMECCDCGLVHDIEHFPPGETCDHEGAYGMTPVGHMYAMRPDGYRYRFRVGAGASDLALDGDVR